MMSAVPAVATSLNPMSTKRRATSATLGLVVIVDADEHRALRRQLLSRRDLRLGERFAEIFAHAHHFAGGAHLRAEHRIDAREIC